MNDNPYHPSGSPDTAESQQHGQGEEFNKSALTRLAVFQKGVIFSILAYLLCALARFLAPPELQAMVFLFALPVMAIALLFTLLLAIEQQGWMAGILLTLCCLIPFINLIIMAAISNQANNTFRKAGVRVGFLGARWSDLQ